MLRRISLRHARPSVAAGLFAASVLGWVALIASDPARYWRQTDAIVYRDAGAAVWHGHQLYPVLFGPFHLPFTYPPFPALVFAPFSGLPFGAWQMGLAVVSLGCLLIAAHAAVRAAGGTSSTGAYVVAAVGLWLEPVIMTLHFGQLNLLLLALVLVDLSCHQGRWRGVGVGLAAGIKLTPLIFIPYLWFTGRRRAAAVAVGTFLATFLIGLSVLPHDAARYWWRQVVEPGDGPQRLVNQSLRGALLRVAHRESGDIVLWLSLAIAVGIVGLTAAVLATRRGLPLLGICLCATTGLLVSPVSWSHHWVYVVPVLALVFDQRLGARARALSGSALVVLFAWWPTSARGPSGLLRLAPHDSGRELRWNALQLAYGDYYALAALGFVLAAAVLLARPSSRWQVAVGVT